MMDALYCRSPRLVAVAVTVLVALAQGTARQAPTPLKASYVDSVRPLIKKYCLDCHSTKAKKGSLDLERFATFEQVRKELKPWQQTIEMLQAGEMPPRNKPQPTVKERQRLIAWVREFLDVEARARAGDPGHVPLRRLSNAEYDYTIRDLTGVDLRPTREFPADGAAGEGFTNAAEALSDISPALLTKYFNAAKEIAEHAVLLPDGFRFSPGKTRRDWTDESLARLRAFYADFTADGRLAVQPYLLATVRHRDALKSSRTTLDEVAQKEKLNAKYLTVLWRTLTDEAASHPLDLIRARWQQAAEKDVASLAADIARWQALLWKFVPIGSYRYGNTIRQVANDPSAGDTQPLRLAVKPAPGQSDVVLYLVTRDLSPNEKGPVIWHRPRFESAGKPPLLLRDYPQFGAAYEIDYSRAFGDSARYLAAAAEAAHDNKRSANDLANKHGLDAALLERWIALLDLRPLNGATEPDKFGRTVPAIVLDLLDEKAPNDGKRPAVNGWRRKGAELPVLLTNSSDKVEQVPGRMPPHRVAVHPTPTEFVAVAWKSPLAGSVRVSSRIAHAHPACGNGVAWWLEHRRGDRAAVLSEGVLDLGGETKLSDRILKIEMGDLLLLAVDARKGNHFCDLTEIGLTITEAKGATPQRTWDLAADIADSVLNGNPHADKHGNKGVWSFVKGKARAVGKDASVIPPGSLLDRWRDLAADPAQQLEARKLAEQVQALLSGARPPKDKTPDRILYDNFLAPESALLQGLDLARFAKARPKEMSYGIGRDRFGQHPNGAAVDEASLAVAANSVTEVRLPAALFRDREFVVEGKLGTAPGERVVQFQVLTAPPATNAAWEAGPVVASPTSAAYKRLLQEYAEFRRCFPQFICFPRIIPDDEVVCLKMYHREDEALARLFLDDEQQRRLDRLWLEHRFISQQPVAENAYLPQFIGYVTQDQPKELLAYFEGQRPVFRKRAEEFEKDMEAARPRQFEVLLDFAARAYRRPLHDSEKADLDALYRRLRDKGAAHEEAFRGVLVRVLVSPAFLFRVEQAPPGKEAGAVNDWELATRLSYFLWSSLPDEELRRLAAAGRLRDPQVIAEQTRRMLRDERVRALAIEFGAQWLHVRGFDELKEKNEKLFPTFDAALRKAIYEETILFFQDLFQGDRSVTQILDADHTFLNETLAKHYGIPSVSGPEWRRVEGVRKHGRGGILGLASVQATQSGASRTSPVLRGNWVVETLLGEKLPRPPANVPRLPEEEGGADKLTTRQLVEKHAGVAECAVCHQRIDPFGFALERYDAIGRRRDKDLGGLIVDARAKLKDGTEFDDIEGLRTYLLTRKQDVIVRLVCRKLLGYALGRSVALSDQPLLDELAAELKKRDGRFAAAILTIVRSPQFRMVRGSEFGD